MGEDGTKGTKRGIEDTKEYYRKRAPQYSDWAQDTGKHEGGSAPDPSVFAEGRMLLDAARKAMLSGDVLEIACGTGVLTEAIVENASSVTAMDSSDEMIGINSDRLKHNPKVRYVNSDFYEWTPDRAYDAVAFSFWISHVPNAKLEEFVAKVVGCLKPRGKVFLADQRVEALKYEELVSPGGEVVSRNVEDGTVFHVFKHFYEPQEIADCFARHQAKLTVGFTPTHFFYAHGERVQ